MTDTHPAVQGVPEPDLQRMAEPTSESQNTGDQERRFLPTFPHWRLDLNRLALYMTILQVPIGVLIWQFPTFSVFDAAGLRLTMRFLLISSVVIIIFVFWRSLCVLDARIGKRLEHPGGFVTSWLLLLILSVALNMYFLVRAQSSRTQAIVTSPYGRLLAVDVDELTYQEWDGQRRGLPLSNGSTLFFSNMQAFDITMIEPVLQIDITTVSGERVTTTIKRDGSPGLQAIQDGKVTFSIGLQDIKHVDFQLYP